MTKDDRDEAYQKRLEQKTTVTSRLSESTRFVAFGIVAWVFAVQASDASFSKSYVLSYEGWINLAGALAVLSIACDYLQYLCAYFSVEHALKRKDQAYKFNRRHPSYLLQNLFFWIKQLSVGAGAVQVAVTFTVHALTN